MGLFFVLKPYLSNRSLSICGKPSPGLIATADSGDRWRAQPSELRAIEVIAQAGGIVVVTYRAQGRHGGSALRHRIGAPRSEDAPARRRCSAWYLAHRNDPPATTRRVGLGHR